MLVPGDQYCVGSPRETLLEGGFSVFFGLQGTWPTQGHQNRRLLALSHRQYLYLVKVDIVVIEHFDI
jgi:hypothetical protein